MRILLTGATGYLGGWIRHALEADHQVICVMRPDGRAANDDAIAWDMTQPAPGNLPAVDAIVHAAQSRHYSQFPDGALDVFGVNCMSTARLLDFAVATGIRRFCLISSGSVYEPYAGDLDEASALAPTSLNGAGKLAAEIVSRPYEQKVAVSRLRLFFPYGPGQTQRMVPGLIDRIKRGTPVTLDGADGLIFSPLYASDVGQVVKSAVENAWTGAVNVAGPQTATLGGFARALGAVLGITPALEHTGKPAPRIVPPLKRLAELYPTGAMIGVEEGVQMTVGGQR